MPRAQTNLPIPPKPQGQPPNIFGRGVRDRLLMTLAIHERPFYIAELAHMLGSDPSKLWKTIKVLQKTGQDATRPSG
jgi:hypothetical protein